MEAPILPEESPIKERPLYIKALLIIAKAIGYGFALFLFAGLLSYVMVVAVPGIELSALEAEDVSDWQSLSVVYIGVLLAALGVTYIFVVGIDNQPFSIVGLTPKKWMQKLLNGAFQSILLLSITFLILWLVQAVEIVDLQFEYIDLLGFFGLFFIAAFVEEIIFRGYLIPLIARDFHFMAALIVSSLIFAWVHVTNDHFTWVGFWNIFLGGYWMGLVFMKTRELYTPLGLHWIWNYFQGNILGFGVSGHEVESLLTIEQHGADWLSGGEFGMEGSIVSTILLVIVCWWLTKRWYNELSQNNFVPMKK